eukprot:scaffold116722_cov75-Phaeocystis_antarctica.AAC.3
MPSHSSRTLAAHCAALRCANAKSAPKTSRHTPVEQCDGRQRVEPVECHVCAQAGHDSGMVVGNGHLSPHLGDEHARNTHAGPELQASALFLQPLRVRFEPVTQDVGCRLPDLADPGAVLAVVLRCNVARARRVVQLECQSTLLHRVRGIHGGRTHVVHQHFRPDL